MGKVKLSQGKKKSLINQLLSVVLDGREQICKKVTKFKMCGISWLRIPQGVSSPVLLYMATSSAKKSLPTFTSHWDSVRGRFCLISAALFMHKQIPITSQREQKNDKARLNWKCF